MSVDFLNSEQVLLYARKNFGDVISCELQGGGLANYVYRLTYSNRTTILKYYPPYLSSNTAYSFSQERYFVEKEALQVFSDLSTDKIKVPKLLQSIDEEYVLIMEDAGEDIISLTQFFKNDYAGLTWDCLHSSIVEFLATLHQYDISTLSELFKNPLARETNEMFYSNLRSQQLPSLEAFSTTQLPKVPRKPSIIMGDLWPNSIYLNFETRKVWIIDWEFARFGKGFDDVAQCVGNLWLMEQKGNVYNAMAVKRFRQDLVKEYLFKTKTNIERDDQIRCLMYIVLLTRFPNWTFHNPEEVINIAVKNFNGLLLE